MKKIMLIGNHDIVIYNFRKELINKLISENFKVYIILPYGKKVDLLVEAGCQFIDVPIDRRGTNIISDLLLIKHYYKIVKSIKPDMVLTYTIKPNIYGGIACRINKIPYITNITGLGSVFEKEGVLQLFIIHLYRIAFKKVNCIFFQNDENINLFFKKNISINKHRLIPGSGVNISQHYYEEYPTGEKIKILFIGRLMKEKGVHELFYVAEKIYKIYNNVQFEFIGFCEENLEKKIKLLTDKNIIYYYGHQDNVHEYIKNAHAIILPSYHEGMANVLLEASATGRPVLASNISGCKEIFVERITGFGFEPRNIKSLYNAIVKFIETPLEEKREMGINARIRMEQNFNRDYIVNAYMEEIQKY